ncbi:MAG: hypothetical protein LBQ18_01560 [Campylobacteraceae bacterium]|nr:hypothetical protein [Campylobacteraceae bacterium]
MDCKQKFFASYANISKALVLLFAFTLAGCGDAQTPEVTFQPKSKLATAGEETTLTVSASVADGGALTYQWYQNSVESSVNGTLLEDSNTPIYRFTPSADKPYYYVVIINTNNDATGNKTASVTSSVAKITVVNESVSTLSFYDDNLDLVDEVTVVSGTVVNIAAISGTWYEADGKTPVTSHTANADAGFYTAADVRGIRDQNGLELVRKNLSGRYALLNDITLTTGNSEGWLPIGDATEGFSGKFNGNGHVIKGLWVDRPTADYVGLFGHINKGSVINLKVEIDDAHNGIQGKDYVGSIAGATQRGTITAVDVRGGIKGNSYVGGITGKVNIGTITATASKTDIVATGNYVGSITGYINLGTITASYTRGDVSSPNGDYVGGIAGYSEISTITATYSYGKVDGNNYVGGIAGYLQLGTIVASYLHGSVTGHSDVNAIAGKNALGIILASFADGGVTQK